MRPQIPLHIACLIVGTLVQQPLVAIEYEDGSFKSFNFESIQRKGHIYVNLVAIEEVTSQAVRIYFENGYSVHSIVTSDDTLLKFISVLNLPRYADGGYVHDATKTYRCCPPNTTLKV